MIAYQKDFFLNVIGNHGLAKGGSGDVLCGICAGLYGQGKDMKTSAICGVYVHAKAADLLKEVCLVQACFQVMLSKSYPMYFAY